MRRRANDPSQEWKTGEDKIRKQLLLMEKVREVLTVEYGCTNSERESARY